jgi:hypothetical protein
MWMVGRTKTISNLRRLVSTAVADVSWTLSWSSRVALFIIGEDVEDEASVADGRSGCPQQGQSFSMLMVWCFQNVLILNINYYINTYKI